MLTSTIATRRLVARRAAARQASSTTQSPIDPFGAQPPPSYLKFSSFDFVDAGAKARVVEDLWRGNLASTVDPFRADLLSYGCAFGTEPSDLSAYTWQSWSNEETADSYLNSQSYKAYMADVQISLSSFKFFPHNLAHVVFEQQDIAMSPGGEFPLHVTQAKLLDASSGKKHSHKCVYSFDNCVWAIS